MEWNGEDGKEMDWRGMEINEREKIGGKCHDMERSGVEWSGVEWSGVEWSGRKLRGDE